MAGFADRGVRLRATGSSHHANRLDVPTVEPPHLAVQPHRHLPGLDLEDGAPPSARPRIGPARGQPDDEVHRRAGRLGSFEDLVQVRLAGQGPVNGEHLVEEPPAQADAVVQQSVPLN